MQKIERARPLPKANLQSVNAISVNLVSRGPSASGISQFAELSQRCSSISKVDFLHETLLFVFEVTIRHCSMTSGWDLERWPYNLEFLIYIYTCHLDKNEKGTHTSHQGEGPLWGGTNLPSVLDCPS